MATQLELDKVRKLREHAAEMVGKGKVPAALAAYIDILKIVPGDALVRQKLAETLGRTGRKAEAIEQYRHLAGKYASEGHLLKAIAICSVILQLDPAHKETQATLADLYSQRDAAAPKPMSLPADMAGAIPRDSIEIRGRYGAIGAKLILPDDPRHGGAAGHAPPKPSSPPPKPSTPPPRVAPPQPPSVVAELPPSTRAPAHAPPSSTPPASYTPLPHHKSFTIPPLGLSLEGAVAGEDVPYSADEPLPIDLATLTRIPLFSDLDRAAFIAVLERLQLRPMRAGDVIVREGDPGDSMFAIAQGIVRVVRQAERLASPTPGAQVRDRLLAELADGAFFGEMALLARGPRLATVIAATDGTLLEFSRTAVEQIVAMHPRVKDVILHFHKTRLLSNVLRSSPIFRPFNADEKKHLVEQFRVRSFPPGHVVLEQGQEGSGFFVLLRGQCEVSHAEMGAGPPMQLPTMTEGDVFGELSLLTDGIVTATVKTKTDCVVLGLHRKFFQDLVLVNAEVRAALTELSKERSQRTQGVTDDDLVPESDLL